MSFNAQAAVSPWLRCYKPRPSARVRLICLPHAGGAASFYRSWARHLPGDVELLSVQYPGREDRIHEPLLDDMHRVADVVAASLEPMLDRPLAFFGHSMGAVVAYEVALRVPRAFQLFASARQAPVHARPGRRHLADDDTLWAEVRRLGGVNELVLAQPDLRALALPVLRNDFRMIETYQPSANGQLECPVVGLVGEADPAVSVDEMRAWAELTRGAFSLRAFPGDHFYLVREREQLIDELVRQLGDQLA